VCDVLREELRRGKAPGGKTTGGQASNHLSKLTALLVERNIDAMALEEGAPFLFWLRSVERPGDLSFVPWPEIAQKRVSFRGSHLIRFSECLLGQLESIMSKTGRGDRVVPKGAQLEGCLGAMERLSRSATLASRFVESPMLAKQLLRLIADYADGVYSGQNYGLPAMALRCIRRMASKLAPSLVSTLGARPLFELLSRKAP